MKRAFLFSGQGSQAAGMSGALAASCEDCLRKLAQSRPADGLAGGALPPLAAGTAMVCPECQATFQVADRTLGYPLSVVIARGSSEELRRTEIQQPMILSLTVAEAYRLIAQGLVPDALAGHSLGQYAALVVAGAIEFEKAVRLVAARGRLMQRTVPDGKGAMMAIMGLDRRTIYDACVSVRSIGIVGVALHNSPGQTVISGERPAVLAAADRCEEEGGGAVEVPVSVPFHCDLLAPMAPTFARLVDAAGIRDPKLPVIDNVTARPLTDADSVRESLVLQLTHPVLFEESLDYLVNTGVDHFIQCGPGKSLLNFVQRVSRTAITETFEMASSSRARPRSTASTTDRKAFEDGHVATAA